MLYCLIERLVLKSFGTSWVWNVVLAIPRLLLSLAIALVVGLPISQVIYSGSINDQLSRDTTTRIQQATTEITKTYGRRSRLRRKRSRRPRGRKPTCGSRRPMRGSWPVARSG